MMIEIGARPHLGKYTQEVDATYLAQLYGQNFKWFKILAAEHDPQGKFVNAFTGRLFGLG